MACFYAMDELGVHLEQVEIQNGRYAKQVGTKRVELGGHFVGNAAIFEASEHDPVSRKFFTMRVCKDCRADWMAAIQQWFREGPPDRASPETGIYTRIHGATREVTEEGLR